MTGRPLRAALVALAIVVGACGDGGGSEDGATAPPPKVPVALVPPSIASGALTVTEDGQAKEAFTKLGDNALVADGRLWQFRQDDRLVATLQVSTVKAKVDLADDEQRRSIVRHILPGTRRDIEINGLTVSMSDSNDKTVYVWFGRELFQVLQVKSTKLDPEAVVTELVGFQVQSPEWKALPVPEDEVES